MGLLLPSIQKIVPRFSKGSEEWIALRLLLPMLGSTLIS